MTPAVAIVGMACRYPDARTPDELWENVLACRQAFRRIPPERLRLADYFSSDRATPDATYSAQAAVIDGFEFDREKFRVSGSTFRAVDMTHWLALDVAARALADAGFAGGAGLNESTTGVLLGNSLTGEFSRANLMRLRWPYVRRIVDAALEKHDISPRDREAFWSELEESYKAPFPPVGDESLAGGLANTIAGRICNYFGFKGGGYTVDGACASSLLAIANACSALVAEDLDVAMAGGVDLSIDPFELVGFAKVGALAEQVMRVYDARSAGFLPGEGCGMVVLMRAADAIAQARPIYALIRGWGISSDGRGGLTRPEYEGQKLAFERAYKKAGFGADTIGYFEGHGTGTAVGDATELKVIGSARRAAEATAPPAAIGSIKANIGHTKAAAGVAGFIKATMALRAQLLPPTTGWETPHAELSSRDGAAPALELLREGRAWPADRPLRAAVSAMGFGGINTHVVLEGAARHRRRAVEPNARRLLASTQDAELFLFAAENPQLLGKRIHVVAERVEGVSLAEMADLAAHLSRHSEDGPARAAIVAGTPAELTAGLRQLGTWLAAGETTRFDARTGAALGVGGKAPRLGFLFPGQGSPTHIDGGAWRRRFETVAELYAASGLSGKQDTVATEIAQPAICAASLAGMRLLEQLGIQATVAVGHSLGELTAYCWAGAFDEAALLRIAAARGRAIAEFGKPGGMASISASDDQIRSLLVGEPVVVSGLNSPTQTIVSGDVAAIERIVAHARAHGYSATKLAVSHAFHSPLVADSAAALARFLASEAIAPLGQRVVSTISGGELAANDDLRRLLEIQMNSPVRLMDAVQAAAERVDLWLEVGPGAVLNGIVAPQVAAPIVALDAAAESLRPLLRGLGLAFAMGAPLRHRELFNGRFTRPFDLERTPKFLANPCEQAPIDDRVVTPVTVNRPVAARSLENKQTVADSLNLSISVDPAVDHASTNGHAPKGEFQISDAKPRGESPHDLVKRLVAERAELPLSAIGDDDRLLSDLHLTSLAVGHLVAEASRALGLPPPASPTDYAQATVAQVAAALEQLVESGPAPLAARSEVIGGVGPWVRSFAIEWVERKLPAAGVEAPKGDWQIIGPADHPLVAQLRARSGELAGSGVILCLPASPDERNVAHFLAAVRALPAGGDDPHFVVVQQSGGGGSFARTLHLENPNVTTCVVDLPLDHANAANWVVQEIRAARGHVEARYDATGVRRERVWRLAPAASELSALPLGPADVLLVSGGGKGIAAECALDLAKKTGARLALVGRSSPEHDSELSANLRRMAAAGVAVRYFSADVCDAEAVHRAVLQAETELGRVTAIIHGAGTNTPRLISALDEAAFDKTLRPKLSGLRNLLTAVNPSSLRLLVTFGSIIAEAGLQGEADYAVANEWLARLTADWGASHPHCRALCIEWSVWSGVGMGERLGRIESLVAQGISPITPDQGVAALSDLLRRSSLSGPVVVSGRFGNPPTVKLDEPQLPLWRFIERPRYHLPGVELVVDAELSSAADPHIRDHVFQGTPLFAAVMGLEAMAQTALALSGAKRASAFEDVVLSRPIIVPDGKTAAIRICALARDARRIDVVVRAAETDFQVDHFRATCVVTADTAALPSISRLPSLLATDNGQPTTDKSTSLDPRSDLYGSILFHRGQFQRVRSYCHLKAKTCTADIGPDGAARWYGAFFSDTLLLGDPGARDAAIHAIQACIPQGTILPIGVARIVLGSAPLAAPCVVHARERSHEGDLFVYDMEIRSQAGQVLESWEGLQLRQVRAAEPPVAWPEPLLVPYLERQLAALFGGVEISVAIERHPNQNGNGHAGTNGLAHIRSNGSGNGVAQRAVRSHGAMGQALGRQALGHAVEVLHRPDGKPEVFGGQHVSAAHAGELTISVASDGLVSCDLEAVVDHSADTWRDLLGAERYRLAEQIASHDAGDMSAAATRVWTAIECLKKAGAPSDASLSIRGAAAEGWLALGSGGYAIATLATSIRGTSGVHVIAVLATRPADHRLATRAVAINTHS